MGFDLSFVNKENVQGFIDAFQNDGKIDSQEAQKLKLNEQIQNELNNAFTSGELTMGDFVKIQNAQSPTGPTSTQNKIAKNNAAKVAKEKENAQVLLKMSEIKSRIDKLVSDALDSNNHEYKTMPQKQEILNLILEIKEIRLQGLNFTTLTAEQQEEVEQYISEGTDKNTAIYMVKNINGDFEINNENVAEKEFEEFINQSVTYVLLRSFVNENNTDKIIDDITDFVNKEITKKLIRKKEKQAKDTLDNRVNKTPSKAPTALDNADTLVPGLGKKIKNSKINGKKEYEQWKKRGY